MPTIHLRVGEHRPLYKTLEWPGIPRPGESFDIGHGIDHVELEVDRVDHVYGSSHYPDGVHVFLLPRGAREAGDEDSREIGNEARRDLVGFGFTSVFPDSSPYLP